MFFVGQIQSRTEPVAPDRLVRLERWLKAVDQHAPLPGCQIPADYPRGVAGTGADGVDHCAGAWQDLRKAMTLFPGGRIERRRDRRQPA